MTRVGQTLVDATCDGLCVPDTGARKRGIGEWHHKSAKTNGAS
jgi:hypothetical protein